MDINFYLVTATWSSARVGHCLFIKSNLVQLFLDYKRFQQVVKRSKMPWCVGGNITVKITQLVFWLEMETSIWHRLPMSTYWRLLVQVWIFKEGVDWEAIGIYTAHWIFIYQFLVRTVSNWVNNISPSYLLYSFRKNFSLSWENKLPYLLTAVRKCAFLFVKYTWKNKTKLVVISCQFS